MTALVVGDPADGALDACAALGPGGTLAWCSTEGIRAAADRLADLGWAALLVDPEDEGFSTSSMSLLTQMHGHPRAVVVHSGQRGADPVVPVAVMVLRHLPVLPVVLTGPGAGALTEPLAAPAGELELDEPLVVAIEDLDMQWRALVGTPRDSEE